MVCSDLLYCMDPGSMEIRYRNESIKLPKIIWMAGEEFFQQKNRPFGSALNKIFDSLIVFTLSSFFAIDNRRNPWNSESVQATMCTAW